MPKEYRESDPPEPKKHECMYCGKPIDKKNQYCSIDCFKADML